MLKVSTVLEIAFWQQVMFFCCSTVSGHWDKLAPWFSGCTVSIDHHYKTYVKLLKKTTLMCMRSSQCKGLRGTKQVDNHESIMHKFSGPQRRSREANQEETELTGPCTG